MRHGSIYFVVRDFEKSLDFYEKVLDMKVSATNGTRFAMFNNDGLNICLIVNRAVFIIRASDNNVKSCIYPLNIYDFRTNKRTYC